MAFDDSCRVESFPEFPDWQIEEHLQRHENQEEGYSGLSRADLREGRVKKPARSINETRSEKAESGEESKIPAGHSGR
jgi:hypothetical protein